MQQRAIKEVAAAMSDNKTAKRVAATTVTHNNLEKKAPATEYVAGA